MVLNASNITEKDKVNALDMVTGTPGCITSSTTKDPVAFGKSPTMIFALILVETLCITKNILRLF